MSLCCLYCVGCRGQGGSDIPQDAIQALDVALKYGTLLNPLCTAVSRAFFFPDPDTTHSLGGGAEVQHLPAPSLSRR